MVLMVLLTFGNIGIMQFTCESYYAAIHETRGPITSTQKLSETGPIDSQLSPDKKPHHVGDIKQALVYTGM